MLYWLKQLQKGYDFEFFQDSNRGRKQLKQQQLVTKDIYIIQMKSDPYALKPKLQGDIPPKILENSFDVDFENNQPNVNLIDINEHQNISQVRTYMRITDRKIKNDTVQYRLTTFRQSTVQGELKHLQTVSKWQSICKLINNKYFDLITEFENNLSAQEYLPEVQEVQKTKKNTNVMIQQDDEMQISNNCKVGKTKQIKKNYNINTEYKQKLRGRDLFIIKKEQFEKETEIKNKEKGLLKLNDMI